MFDQWAKSIAAGVPFDYAATGHEFAYWAAADPGVYPQAPLYPWFIAGLYEIFGPRYDGVRAVQMTLGALAAALLAALALRWTPWPVALAAGLAAAAYGPFVFYEGTFLRAGVVGFAVALSLWLLVCTAERFRDRTNDDDRRAGPPTDGASTTREPDSALPRASRRGWRAAAWPALVAGIVLAVCVLLRANLLVFAASAVVWLYVSVRRASRSPAAARRASTWLAVGIVVPLLPVIAVNTIRSGHPAFISSNAAYIFFLGNVHDSPGNSAGPSPYYYQVKRSGPREAIDLRREAWADIAGHPRQWLVLQMSKLADLFGVEETPNNLSYAMARKTNPRLRLAFVEYWMVVPLALLGAIVGLGRTRAPSVLYVFVVAYTAATVPFYVLARLRQPLLLALLLFGAVAVAWWWDRLREGRWVLAGAVAVLVVAATAWLAPEPARLRPTDYAMAAAARFSRAEQQERAMQLDDARASYARALALNPDHDRALLRVLSLDPPVIDPAAEQRAVALCQRAKDEAEARHLDDARDLLEQATRIAPDLALPYQYLANVAYLAGRPREAMEATERAVERDPSDSLLRENLRRLRSSNATS